MYLTFYNFLKSIFQFSGQTALPSPVDTALKIGSMFLTFTFLFAFFFVPIFHLFQVIIYGGDK